MTPAIRDGLEKLIAAVDEQRAATERRKRELLQEEPRWSAGKELIALNEQLDHLQLADDVLSDALTVIRKIDPDDDDGERAA